MRWSPCCSPHPHSFPTEALPGLGTAGTPPAPSAPGFQDGDLATLLPENVPPGPTARPPLPPLRSLGFLRAPCSLLINPQVTLTWLSGASAPWLPPPPCHSHSAETGYQDPPTPGDAAGRTLMLVPPSPSLLLICKLDIHSPGPRVQGALSELERRVRFCAPPLPCPLATRPSSPSLSPWPVLAKCLDSLSRPSLSLHPGDPWSPTRRLTSSSPKETGDFSEISVILPQNYDAANEIGAVAENISTRLGGTVLSCSRV